MQPLILNIDTALETAIISISKMGEVLEVVIGTEQKEHASLLHPAIKNMLTNHSLSIKDLDAVAVIAGPGSYTGLRVGIATAKGLAYALNIPLIAINTLELMVVNAVAILDQNIGIFCPMIDARRMEVFTGLYDRNAGILRDASAIILVNESFEEELKANRIVFFGNGSIKFQNIQNNPNAVFKRVSIIPNAMSLFSYKKYLKQIFTDVSDLQPLYIKEFNTISPVIKP